jgi:predicted permease
MEKLLADLRQALRGMRKSPGFTATAIAALALGIGANTAIFSVVNAVILRPLPYPEPDRLVAVERSFKDGQGSSVSIPKYIFWRDHNQGFESVTAYDFGGPGLNLSAGGGPEQVNGLHVTKDFFHVFGASPMIGRGFTAVEDSPNGPQPVVLTYKLWQRRFAADPNIVGKPVDLSGHVSTIVGVMPRDFEGPNSPDLWMPLQPDPASINQAHYLTVTARLRPGTKIESANSQLKVVMDGFRRVFPKAADPSEGIRAIPLRDQIVGDVRRPLLILVAAVCFVLLIACANMANLLLARAATRQRELAIRAAIGASRGRILRQMLTESVLLSVIGACFGLMIGLWSVRALLRVSPGRIPRVEQLMKASPLAFLDWHVFFYTLGVAVLTGLIFGLLPALRVSAPDLNSTLKEASSRSGTGQHQNRMRGVLVITELAFAVVLLTGAGLLIRTFAGLRTVDTGLDTHNILTFLVSMADGRFSNADNSVRLEHTITEKLEHIPGVTSASTTWMLPLNNNLDLPFNIVGKSPPAGQQYDADTFWRPVQPHFFDTFKLPLRRGRVFRETDTAASQPVVIINETVAKKHWPKEDPIGKQIVIGKGLGPVFTDPPRMIVGVVGPQREDGLHNDPAEVVYLPAAQITEPLIQFANPLLPRIWVVRTTSNPMSFANAAREIVKSTDSKLGAAKIRTMDEVMAEYTQRENFNMLLLSIFAGIALLLAAVGVYGVISYMVEQRTQEIGIRMALGAGQMATLKLVTSQVLILLGTGLTVGIGISILVTRYMASLLYGVKPTDLLTFATVIGALIIVAGVATAVPARRAMRVDPVVALRYE